MPEVMVEYAASSSTTSPNNTLPRCVKRRTFGSGVGGRLLGSQTPPQPAGATNTTPQPQPPTPHSRSFIRNCQRAKRVRFFKNGDQFFKGASYVISTERFRSLDALLEDLTRTLDDLISLPNGVRYLLTLDGQQKVTELAALEDGGSYVCSSTESGFKRIDYENAREPRWAYCGVVTPSSVVASLSVSERATVAEPNHFVYPKIITVVRNGVKPRKVIRLLLNRRTAPTLLQIINDITDAIQLDTGAVRKIFTLDGKLVTGLIDFFQEEDVFIAYGTERMSVDDFYLDSEEYKFLYSSRFRSLKSNAAAFSCKSPKMSSRFIAGRDLDLSSRPSPLLRRKFLHQRNQAKLRSSRRRQPQQQQPLQQTTSTSSSNDAPSSGEATPTHARRPAATASADSSNGGRRRLRPLTVVVDEPSSSGGVVDTSAATTAPPCGRQTADEVSGDFPLDIEDRFKVGRLLGDGLFANVHECICRKTNRRYALKVIDKAKCGGKEELVETEVALLRKVDHEHIVKLYDVWDLHAEYYLCMELVGGGDLFDALVSVRQYDERQASQLLTNLMSALDYLHRMNIVHRDVKPENLLVYQSGGGPEEGRACLKLADFGLATEVSGAAELLYTVCGTPTYVAPEILAETGYGRQVDVWAAGVILYIVLCGFPPFMSMEGNQEELFNQILKGKLSFPSPCWDSISNAAKGLIIGMLDRNKDDRCTTADVLGHPWITNEGVVNASYEELARITVEASTEPSGEKPRYSKPSQSFYEGNNAEFYYSRSRSMDNLSTAPHSPNVPDAAARQQALRERSWEEDSFLFYENQLNDE